MVDDLTRRGPEDPKKINKKETWEMDYWSKKFKVSKDVLKKAIDKVGPETDAVKKELKIK